MNQLIGSIAYTTVFVALLAAALGGDAAVKMLRERRSAQPVVVAQLDSTGPAAAPDAGVLSFYAETAGVPAPIALAVAWEETRNNTSPSVRGSSGEWGRFQILETTAKGRCPGMNVQTTRGNRACFLKMTRENYRRCGGWDCAVRIHNGSGPAASAYADRVLSTARLLVAKEIGA